MRGQVLAVGAVTAPLDRPCACHLRRRYGAMIHATTAGEMVTGSWSTSCGKDQEKAR